MITYYQPHTRLPFSPSVRPSVRPRSTCPSVRPPVRSNVRLSIHPFVCPPTRPSIRPSIYPFNMFNPINYCLCYIPAALLSGTDGINDSDHPLATGIMKNPIQPGFRDGSTTTIRTVSTPNCDRSKPCSRTPTIRTNARLSRSTSEDGLGFEEMIEDEYQRPTRERGCVEIQQ